MLFFNQLTEGMMITLPEIVLTQQMRDDHVAIYGEDWPEPVATIVRKRGVIPSTLVISVLGGQMGKDKLAIWAISEYSFTAKHPFIVGDTLVAKSIVTQTRPNQNPEKNWGYVWVIQEIQNADTATVNYKRLVKYAVVNDEIALEKLAAEHGVSQ